MRTFLTLSLIALFLAALATATGCEDTPLAPGEDSTMIVVANPQSLIFEPSDSTLSSDVSAVVLDSTGAPSSGVAVLFTTTSGTMASGSTVRETDGAGRATDTLTVPRDGPATVTVTATAGSLSETVAITKSNASDNHAPDARIVVTPLYQAPINTTIQLSGSSSDDQDASDEIASYEWRISPAPSQPELVLTGVSASIPGGYPSPEDVTITLKVTDSRGMEGSTSITYFVTTTRTCADNTAPVADIAGGTTQTSTGAAGSTINFVLDGSGSTDAETAIQVYRWNCGNGVPATVSGTGATCRYTVGTSNQTFSVTLEVEDQGFGLPDLECKKTSPQVQISVIIGPPAAP